MSLEDIKQNVIDGDKLAVVEGVQAAMDDGIAADTILKQALIPAMDEVGRRFEAGEFFVPEMLIAARAMQAGLGILKPHLVEGGVEAAGVVAVGTVKGDLHDIGKNLVAMMLEGAGFEVIDLGVDVPPDTFVKVAEDGVDVIGLSALLTTTMPNMEQTLSALQAQGLREQVKVVVGGAPLTQDYADRIGADGYAPDASSAMRLVRQLMGK